MLNDVEVQSAQIAILPPVNSNGDIDVDSGDEFVSSGDPNNLSCNQLLAETTIKI